MNECVLKYELIHGREKTALPWNKIPITKCRRETENFMVNKRQTPIVVIVADKRHLWMLKLEGES